MHVIFYCILKMHIPFIRYKKMIVSFYNRKKERRVMTYMMISKKELIVRNQNLTKIVKEIKLYQLLLINSNIQL